MAGQQPIVRAGPQLSCPAVDRYSSYSGGIVWVGRRGMPAAHRGTLHTLCSPIDAVLSVSGFTLIFSDYFFFFGVNLCPLSLLLVLQDAQALTTSTWHALCKVRHAQAPQSVALPGVADLSYPPQPHPTSSPNPLVSTPRPRCGMRSPSFPIPPPPPPFSLALRAESGRLQLITPQRCQHIKLPGIQSICDASLY